MQREIVIFKSFINQETTSLGWIVGGKFDRTILVGGGGGGGGILQVGATFTGIWAGFPPVLYCTCWLFEL